MRLKQIAAIPHPDGNRIDLYWVTPKPPLEYPCIRIVRRMGTHPISPEGGAMVTEGKNLNYPINEQGRY